MPTTAACPRSTSGRARRPRRSPTPGSRRVMLRRTSSPPSASSRSSRRSATPRWPLGQLPALGSASPRHRPATRGARCSRRPAAKGRSICSTSSRGTSPPASRRPSCSSAPRQSRPHGTSSGRREAGLHRDGRRVARGPRLRHRLARHPAHVRARPARTGRALREGGRHHHAPVQGPDHQRHAQPGER